MAKLLKSAGIVAALLFAMTARAQSSASSPSDAVKKLLAQALDAANQAQDSEAKVKVLETILGLEVYVGNTAAARHNLGTLNKSDDSTRFVVCEVAVALARKGDVREAFAVLRTEGADKVGDSCYSKMADTQGRNGDVDGAVESASHESEPLNRSMDLGSAAREAATAGKSEAANKLFKFALDAARTVEDPATRIESLRMLAFFLAEANRQTEIVALLPEMQTALAGIMDAHERDIRLSEIAEAQASAGTFTDADETIKAIKDGNYQDLARDMLAFALISKGDLSGALKNIEMIQYEPQKANMAIELARASASRGDIAGALSIIGAGSNDFGGVDADLIYAAIAVAQGKRGKIADGSKTARLISSNKVRARTLIVLGAAAPLTDNDHVATMIFSEARAAALNIEELYFRAAALSHLAGILSSREEFEDARKAADAIPNDAEEWMAGDVGKHKGHALENIAYWQCKMGNCKDTLQWVVAEGSPLLRSFAIAGVVEALLRLEPPSDHYGEEGYG
jgi:hypothetical protein